MKTILDMSTEEQALLKELRSEMQREFPDWSFRLTLFGSRARGDAAADSDVDVLVEIHSHSISFEEKRRVRQLAGVLSLNSGFVLSLLIADRLTLEQRGDFSIFRNIREEGFVI
ncbi:MAG: nucleotidyltransferase domain-containing protein [Acidobacteriota bacterium]